MFAMPPFPGGTTSFKMSSWFHSGVRDRLFLVFAALLDPHCSRRYGVDASLAEIIHPRQIPPSVHGRLQNPNLRIDVGVRRRRTHERLVFAVRVAVLHGLSVERNTVTHTHTWP